MQRGDLIKFNFIIALFTGVIGAYLKILHASYSDLFLILALLSNLVFVVAAVYEVRSSKRIDFNEKTMWTVAFLFFPGIAGIVYFTLGRRRV